MKAKLTHDLLRRLSKAGYWVLESDLGLPNEKAILTPKKIGDWENYKYGVAAGVVKEMIISEALKLPERDMIGTVIIPHGFNPTGDSDPTSVPNIC
ncbi:hypothetical protein [Parapedobacter lycopersici]|uniref:hypothetical protein n=1 Tax=Parapedobacter lycopersici TaxID=1864939 RepID=UPI00214D29CA|nr:hypothetical protein [Parapedobacter lycopersici]